MSIVLRIMLVVVCILTCAYTLRKIRKSQMQIEDSLFWIIISAGLVVISVLPDLASFFSHVFGIGATVNFVFLVMIFLLLMKVFLMSLKISQMEDRIKKLVQRIAIRNQEEDKVLNGLCKEENRKELQSEDCRERG